MKNRIFRTLVLVVSFSLMMAACNPDEEVVISQEEITMLQSDNYEEALLDDVDESTDEIVYDLDQNSYSSANLKSAVCYTVTVDKPDSTLFPKTITVDYGDGCSVVIDGDTITKKGVITIVITGRYAQTGATRSVSYTNFFVNNIQIEGTRTQTSLGIDENFNYSWNVSLQNGKMIFPDGTTITREVEKTRTLVTNKTALRTDDYWLTTGTTSGVNYLGENYMKEIVDPLRRNFGCRFIVSGAIEITRNDNVYTIDFGNGTCDRLATLTKDGETIDFTLRWKHNIE